ATGNIVGLPTNNEYPQVGVKLIGDTTQYEQFGPISGRRLSLGINYAYYVSGTQLPDDTSSTLSFDTSLDLRHYFKITRRSLIATALYSFRSTGSLPNVVSFGGIDTLRTIPVYGLFGNTRGLFTPEVPLAHLYLITAP